MCILWAIQKNIYIWYLYFIFFLDCWFVWICIMFLFYKTSSKLYSPPRHQQERSRQRSKGWWWASSHSRERRHRHRRPPCSPQVPRGGWARGWLLQAGVGPRLKDHRNRPFIICTQYLYQWTHVFLNQHFVKKDITYAFQQLSNLNCLGHLIDFIFSFCFFIFALTFIWKLRVKQIFPHWGYF